MFYIYEIRNKINNKTYIGQRKCPENKTPETDSYMGSGTYLKNSKEKYGVENFEKTILAVTETRNNIDILEKVFIKLYREEGKAEYNITDGGVGGCGSGEQNPFYGKHHTEQTKIILRKKCANFGESNGFYGKKHSEETKMKIGLCNKGKIPSDLARKHMSESQKGRKHSDETKKKISESLKGKVGNKPSMETRKMISEKLKGRTPWNKGKKLSYETRRKMSESHKEK